MKLKSIEFETAKLAKEVGFNIDTYSYYWDDDGEVHSMNEVSLVDGICDNWNNNFKYSDYYSAPEQALLQQYLREVHGVIIEIRVDGWFEKGEYLGYRVFIWKIGEPMTSDDEGMYASYEEALEVGLYNSLKIIKDENDR